MNSFIKKIKDNKENIIKVLLMLLVLVSISLITLAVLFATNVMYYEDGFMINADLFNSFKDKWYAVIVFIALQIFLSIFLCTIPGAAMALVVLSHTLYPDEPLIAFLISFTSVIIASTILYILGRVGGYKICVKLLGKSDCDKSLELLRKRGTVYFPLMMLFPIFPDDALVMIAGTTKMKLSWFIPSIVIGRGVGIASVLITTAIIPFDSFTTLYDWLLFITFCVFWLTTIFKLANKLDAHLAKKAEAKVKEKEVSEESSESTL